MLTRPAGAARIRREGSSPVPALLFCGGLARILRLPILVVAQEETLVPIVERRRQEQPRDVKMSHLLEATIRGVDAAADNPEFASCHLLTQVIVLGKMHLLTEPTEFIEALFLEKHEHPSAEGMVQAGQILENIVAGVEKPICEAAIATQNVCGDAVEFLPLRQVERTPYQ
jgi:hypothetical protein